LRRTFSSKVTGLGFGRDGMNRVTNHREGGISDVYDRHQYEIENRRIMESVADHILTIAEGREVKTSSSASSIVNNMSGLQHAGRFEGGLHPYVCLNAKSAMLSMRCEQYQY
jgi:hypothetical protein